MDIETNGAIKLFFPNPSLVQVLFEAVANSFDAQADQLSILIEIQSFKAPDTLKITIQDNGTGFTPESFERFCQLLRPLDSFHKGLGRLIYLNYFEQVAVESTWDDQRRTFTFTGTWKDANKLVKLSSKPPQSTTLVFSGFIKERVKSYNDLNPRVLKRRILEQFLPTLLKFRNEKKDFSVKIELKTAESNEQKDFSSSEEVLTVADLPELTTAKIQDPLFDMFEGVEMSYQVKSGAGENTRLIAISVDNRTIPIDLVPDDAIPLNHSVIFLFSSKLFAGKSDTSRQSLVLPETVPVPELIKVLRREVGKVLAEKIPQIVEKNVRTKKTFEERFPHLLGYFEETTVGIIDKDEALDIAQHKFFRAQKDILESDKLDEPAFKKSLELSSRTLTEYILYRDHIIRKMKEMTADNSETEIHNLIVPRYRQFDAENLVENIYHNNAWLLDDKFMSFQTILSEKKMDEVIEAITLKDDIANDDGRPDIALIFSAEADKPKVDVVVVEIKRITDDEKDNLFAVSQLMKRAQKLVQHCPNIGRIWYYGILQVNDAFATLLKQLNYAPLFSTDKVFYQDFKTERPDGTIVPTPTFIVSFKAIINDAESRNRTFLEILKAEMKALAKEKQDIRP